MTRFWQLLAVLLCFAPCARGRAQAAEPHFELPAPPFEDVQLGLDAVVNDGWLVVPGARCSVGWLHRYRSNYAMFLRAEVGVPVREKSHTVEKLYMGTGSIGLRQWIGSRARLFVETGPRLGVAVVKNASERGDAVYFAYEWLTLAIGTSFGPRRNADSAISVGWGDFSSASVSLRVPVWATTRRAD